MGGMLKPDIRLAEETSSSGSEVWKPTNFRNDLCIVNVSLSLTILLNFVSPMFPGSWIDQSCWFQISKMVAVPSCGSVVHFKSSACLCPSLTYSCRSQLSSSTQSYLSPRDQTWISRSACRVSMSSDPKDNDNADVNSLNGNEDNGDDKDEDLCSGKQGAGELDTKVHGGR